MASTNEAVAALLREYAELLAITGGDPFRARNYEKAAKAVAGYPEDIGRMPAATLTTIPGVGKSIAAKITEYQGTGTFQALEELRTRIPPGVRDLTRVPGLGPKRALALSTELGVATIADLQAAIDEGKLRDLPGFGAKSEERIQRGLTVMTHGRVLLNVAMNTATEIIAALENHSDQVTYAGSLRRMRETIGDVDILRGDGSGTALSQWRPRRPGFTGHPALALRILRLDRSPSRLMSYCRCAPQDST
jgi:DNA polymerase (family 10)